VHGSHDAPDADFVNICIDAGEAFGSGHHGTTEGCLRAIDKLLSTQSFSNCLDIGTGSGVLGIAVAKATTLPVLANDIEPISVDTANANARLNDCADQFVATYGDGAADLVAHGQRFDLIIANILAGPLIDIARDVAQLGKPGAFIVLSGLLDEQRDEVTAAYTAHAMTLEDSLSIEGWQTLIIRAPG
jgi:ribosomal protein L11 methyltransferase